jgi:hypothetical protein
LVAFGCSNTPVATRQPTDATFATASAPATSIAAPTPSVGAPSPSAEAPSDAAVGPEIIVGSERGLEAWRRDGGAKRLVSQGPARAPRWLDAQTLLVLSALDTQNAIRIERISLVDGGRALVATIPSFSCKDRGPSLATVALQTELDFVVDAPRKAACLTLMDRNLNMHDVTLEVLIHLERGTVERWLDTASACRPTKGVARGGMPDSLTCKRFSAPSEPPAPFPFDFSGNTVIRNNVSGSRAQVVRLRDYSANSYSPSGRWLVLDGDVEDGDYIHRRVVLLDRTTGDVFALPKAAGAGLRRLDPSQKTSPPGIPTPIENTFEAVGETTLRWLGTSATDELLVLDDLVLRPQRKAFSVDGEVAR